MFVARTEWISKSAQGLSSTQVVSTGSLLSEAVSRCYILIPYCQHPTKNRDLYCYFDVHTGVGEHKVSLAKLVSPSLSLSLSLQKHVIQHKNMWFSTKQYRFQMKLSFDPVWVRQDRNLGFIWPGWFDIPGQPPASQGARQLYCQQGDSISRSILR